MEVTTEHQRAIDAIKKEMKCPREFKCEKLCFTHYPKVKRLGEVIECLEDDAQDCPHSLSYGYSWVCQCPLNNFVQKLKT